MIFVTRTCRLAMAVAEGSLPMGFGFRSRWLNNLGFGAASDFARISLHGLTEDRLTVDLIWRF